MKRINSKGKNRKHENEKRCCLKSQVNKLQVMILRQKHEKLNSLKLKSKGEKMKAKLISNLEHISISLIEEMLFSCINFFPESSFLIFSGNTLNIVGPRYMKEVLCPDGVMRSQYSYVINSSFK